VVPCVVELGGDPDLFARDTRVLDSLAYFVLVAVCEGSVDVTITCEKSVLDCVADLSWGRLPGLRGLLLVCVVR
jgi:hypothetical protein